MNNIIKLFSKKYIELGTKKTANAQIRLKGSNKMKYIYDNNNIKYKSNITN